MLEYFVTKKIKQQQLKKMDKSAKKNKNKKGKTREHFGNETDMLMTYIPFEWNYFTMILALIISGYAAYLAYNCTLRSPFAVRVFAMIIAFMLNTLYLFYYFVRYVILGDKC
jgi:hypothetical protein